MKSFGWLAAAIMLAVLAGCSQPVQRKDLAGSYTVSIEGMRQELRVDSDGTFETAFYRGNKLAWRRGGHWSYELESDGRAYMAIFDQFAFGFPAYASGGTGVWATFPERSWRGDVILCFDPDLNNRCFVRKRPGDSAA